MDAKISTRIKDDLLKNGYRYLDKLGEGSQAAVLLADDLSSKKKYAVKLFKYEIVYSSHQKKENVIFSVEGYPPPFFEARLGLLCNSPYLLKYHQFFVGVDYMYAITELHTANLGSALFRGCKMNTFEKVEHIFKLGCGLEYLHANRIIHCDLKLDNILVSPHRVVISDLGLSGFADSDDMRRGCHVEETRAPEHIDDEKWIDMLKDYRAIQGRPYSTLEQGEWWTYGIICLHIIYGIIKLEQVSRAIHSHPKCSSYHKKQNAYAAFINIYALSAEKSVEDLMGTFPDGSVEKELIQLLQKYFLRLDPSKRSPIRPFLENPLFKKYGFDISKENMKLPMPLIQTTDPFEKYIPREEVYGPLTQAIFVMNKLCNHFHLYSLILMDAIDFLLQKRIAYNIRSEKLGLYGIISVYLMVLLYDYQVSQKYNFTIANIIDVLKMKISFEIFYDHLMSVISLEAGKFLFESLYYYLETEEQVEYGKKLQTTQLITYLSFKNPREVSELIKNKLFPRKTKKRILVED
jgi:serine/threonine protein kinase